LRVTTFIKESYDDMMMSSRLNETKSVSLEKPGAFWRYHKVSLRCEPVQQYVV